MLHSESLDFHNIEFFRCLNPEFMQTLAFTLSMPLSKLFHTGKLLVLKGFCRTFKVS